MSELPRILLVAYKIKPGTGSEDGSGYHIAAELARRRCHLTIVTRTNNLRLAARPRVRRGGARRCRRPARARLLQARRPRNCPLLLPLAAGGWADRETTHTQPPVRRTPPAELPHRLGAALPRRRRDNPSSGDPSPTTAARRRRSSRPTTVGGGRRTRCDSLSSEPSGLSTRSSGRPPRERPSCCTQTRDVAPPFVPLASKRRLRPYAGHFADPPTDVVGAIESGRFPFSASAGSFP